VVVVVCVDALPSPTPQTHTPQQAVIAMFNGINQVADMGGVKIDEFSAQMAFAVLDELEMAAPENWRGGTAASASKL